MMAKTCYLHIGSPKTGSTSIQAWCFRHKAQLEAQGLLYPGDNRRHDALLSEFHDNASIMRFNQVGRDLTKNGASRELIQADYAEAEASAAQTVFFSNENFLSQSRRIRKEALHRDLTGQFEEVRLLGYMRDPYQMMLSRAQEYIKSGVLTYAQVVDQPPVLGMGGLEEYTRIFGKEAVILRDFDALKASGRPLLEDCLEVLLPGISMEGFDKPRAHNPGLSLEAGLLISALNRRHGYDADWAGRHLQMRVMRNIGTTPFTLPPEAVRSAYGMLMRQYELMDQAGMSFTPPDWDSLPEARPDWSEQTLEQVALAMNRLAGAGKARRDG